MEEEEKEVGEWFCCRFGFGLGMQLVGGRHECCFTPPTPDQHHHPINQPHTATHLPLLQTLLLFHMMQRRVHHQPRPRPVRDGRDRPRVVPKNVDALLRRRQPELAPPVMLPQRGGHLVSLLFLVF